MPSNSAGGLITTTVKVGGTAIPGDYQVHTIEIDQSVNRIATAVISLVDGSPDAENFTISASSTFVPGNEISIEAGYDNTNVVIFSGIITKQSIHARPAVGPMLDVECKDKAVKMTVGRKSATWSKAKDSDAISALIGNAGLSADVGATSVQLPELVQYYVSDWDFMLARAEVNGMLVTTLNGKVRVFDPAGDTSPADSATFGEPEVLGFSAELNAVTQLEQVAASSWNYATQALVSAKAQNSVAGPGNLSSKTLSKVVGLDSFALQTATAESQDMLTAWAKAQMLRSQLSKITGKVRLQGKSTYSPGKYLTLGGLGARFDGDHFMSSVRHELADGNWITEVKIGMSPIWFVQERTIEAPEAAGLLPGIAGVYNATVKKIDNDPDSEYRILVDVALFNDTSQGLWARLANFYSTDGQGVFFLPEVGDEVVLGFLNQDPRYPVILGSLYSQKKKPFSVFSPNAKNTMKGIVSKKELRVLFDDDNTILTLLTPKNNTLVLDDKNGQIEMKDQNGNSIVMSSSGIAIKSNKTISIQAAQNVSIKGDTGIAVESSAGDVTTKGINIQETAQMQYGAKGSVSAQVEGGVSLTLKAAMVMIN